MLILHIASKQSKQQFQKVEIWTHFFTKAIYSRYRHSDYTYAVKFIHKYKDLS